MKRIVIIGTFAAFTLGSCGGSENNSGSEDSSPEVSINPEQIIEIEETTSIVEEGLKDLEEQTISTNSEIDSLLNGI